MRGTTNNVISTQVDDETLKILNDMCDNEERSMSSVLKRIVREYLKEHQNG